MKNTKTRIVNMGKWFYIFTFVGWLNVGAALIPPVWAPASAANILIAICMFVLAYKEYKDSKADGRD